MPFLTTSLIVGAGLAVAGQIWRNGRKNLDQAKSEATERAAAADVPTAPDPEDWAEEEAEAKADRNLSLAVASASLGAGGALGAPLLGVLAVPPMIVIAVPLIRDRVKMVAENDRRNVALVELASFGGAIVTGFFFAAAIGEVFILTSEKLLRKTRRSSRTRLADLFGEQPRTAWIMRDGVAVEVPIREVQRGDLISVVAGSVVPLDGIIVEGVGRIDERALTGESQPADKGVGDRVFATTLMLQGQAVVRCLRTGDESVTADIGRILTETSHYTDTVVSRGERIVDRGALPTLALTALTLPLLGAYRALAVSYCSFGYAMRIAAPISALNYLYSASKQGVLIKDGRALEELGEVDYVVFDKTGTLTREVPEVQAIWPIGDLDEDTMLAFAAAMEKRQSHPIAEALLAAAAERGVPDLDADERELSVGSGLSGRVDGRAVLIGSRRMMQAEGLDEGPDLRARADEAHRLGGTLVYVAVDGVLVGAIELRPVVRTEAREIVSELQRRGIKVAILSGDHTEPTRAVAAELGIDRYFAEVLPQEKSEVVRQLQAEGHRVCFVGDGINDAIALKSANVSVSIQGATSVATDTAAVVLLDGSLRRLPDLFDLAGEMQSNLTAGATLSVVPGIACVVLVYTSGLGLIGSIMLYNLSLAISVANAMRPLAMVNRKAAAVDELETDA